MKKTKIIIFCVLLSVILTYPVKAAEDDIPLRDVLVGKNETMIDEYIDPDLFDESMEGISWEGQPILIVFSRLLCGCANMTYEELIQDTFESSALTMVLLYDEPIGIGKYKHETKIGSGPYDVDAFLQDILEGKATQEFLGESCRINNVFCFGAFAKHDMFTETAVLYETDRGLYVRVYADWTAEPVEFTWENYCEYARPYVAYCNTPELNYDENGYPKAFHPPTFLEFVENPTKYVPDYGKEPESPWLVWCLAGAGVFVVGVVVAAIFLLRRRKKHQATEE